MTAEATAEIAETAVTEASAARADSTETADVSSTAMQVSPASEQTADVLQQ